MPRKTTTTPRPSDLVWEKAANGKWCQVRYSQSKAYKALQATPTPTALTGLDDLVRRYLVNAAPRPSLKESRELMALLATATTAFDLSSSRNPHEAATGAAALGGIVELIAAGPCQLCPSLLSSTSIDGVTLCATCAATLAS